MRSLWSDADAAAMVARHGAAGRETNGDLAFRRFVDDDKELARSPGGTAHGRQFRILDGTMEGNLASVVRWGNSL